MSRNQSNSHLRGERAGGEGWMLWVGYQYISDQDIIVYLTKSKEKMVQLHRFFSYLAVHPKAFAIHPSSFFIFLTSRFDVDQYHQQ